MKQNIFTEFGLDFDNNKFGLGYSTEIEYPNGKEIRVKKFIKMKNKTYYFRFWIFKTVMVINKNGIKIIKKNRNNFKIVFGIGGVNYDITINV